MYVIFNAGNLCQTSFSAGLHDSRSVLSLSAAELERLTGLTAVSITHLKDAISECVLKHQAVTGNIAFMYMLIASFQEEGGLDFYINSQKFGKHLQ